MNRGAWKIGPFSFLLENAWTVVDVESASGVDKA